MKNNFQSKAVPRGTRTLWRYLSALILLFSLGIGQMWAAVTVQTGNAGGTAGNSVNLTSSAGTLSDGTTARRLFVMSGGSTYTGTDIQNTTGIDVLYGNTASTSTRMGSTSNLGPKLESGNKGHVQVKVETGDSVVIYWFHSSSFSNKTMTVSKVDPSDNTKGVKVVDVTGINLGTSKRTSCTGWKSTITDTAYFAFNTTLYVYAVKVIPAPAKPTISGETEYTESATISLTATCSSGADASTTYTWYKGATWNAATKVQNAATAANGGNVFTKTAALDDSGVYWCEASNGGTLKSHNETGKSISVTASSASKYDIIYNNTKGASNTNPVQYTEGIGVASFAALADVDGFHFTGWNPSSIAADASGDKTINATWVPTYNVSFDKGAGGGTAPAGFQKWENATFDLPGQGEMTAPEGRVFGGWKVGVNDKYAAGDTYTMGTTSVEFIAQWDVLIEQVLYSWEGAAGGATEVGGTAVGSESGLVNTESEGYYCLRMNGNTSYDKYIEITLSGTEKVKTGDKIKYWGFYSNSSDKNVAPKMRDGNDPYTEIFADATNLPKIYGGSGTPAQRTFTVPAGINTNKVQLTRNKTGASTMMPKLQITREKAVPEEDIRTVTFNTNGGSSIATVSVEKGTAVAKPANPTKAHCRFEGWQLSGSNYDFSSAVNSNITLDAVWTQLYTVTFANGGGTGDAPAAVADKAQGETFSVPANTFAAPENKEFDKWNDGSADYAPGATYTVGNANVVLTAVWKAMVSKYTVIFKDGDVTLGTKQFDVASNPSDAEIDKTKPLYTFAAWQKDEADIALDAAFWATVVKDATVTLTARWTKAYAQSIDMEQFVIDNTKAGNWHAYLDSKGYAYASSNMSLDSLDGGKTKNNYQYLGLKFNKNSENTYVEGNLAAGKLMVVKVGAVGNNTYMKIDGAKVAEPAIVGGVEADSAAAYTYWYYDTDKTFSLFHENGGTSMLKGITITDPYEVSYDANGGDPVAAQYGEPYVTLPLPVKGTESFLGWFNGETNVGMNGDKYTPTANITLKAHWEAVSTDARLASITFSSDAGTLSPTFDPEVVNYTYTMPYGTAAIPTITGATSVNAKAQDPIIGEAATAWGGTQTVQGVAQSGDKKTYTITMAKAPKDGTSIIKVATTGGTNKTVTGAYAGDGDVSLSSGDEARKMNKYNYIGFILDGTTLQAGDKINVHTTVAANTGGSHLIFYDNMTDKNELYDTEEIGGLGDNIFTINAAMVGATRAYVYRSNADDVHKWNAYVDYIEVTRIMMPELTAISFNGVAATKGTGEAYSVTLPEAGTNLASLTIVPTIIRNAAHATTPQAVVSNEGAWVEGANTYRVMDKDGDYTDYTITITLIGAAETPVITADPAGAAYCAGNEPTLTVAANDPSDGGTLHYAWFKEAGETDEAVGTDLASYTVEAAGTYYVIVTNQKEGKLDASATSANAVVTLNAPASITTQPTDLKKQTEGANITLSVVAANATAYQWYSCDNKDKENPVLIAGADEAEYEFAAAAGFFYCEVTGLCGAIESNVAEVTVKRSAGCQYITATSGYETTEGGLYICGTSNSDGLKATSGTVFATASNNAKAIDADADGAFNKQYIIFKFPVDVEEFTLYGYSTSTRSINNVRVNDHIGTNSNTDKFTSAMEIEATKTATKVGNDISLTAIMAEPIDHSNYVNVKFNGAIEIYRICYTEALPKPVLPTLGNQELCAGAAYAEIDATITNVAACTGTVSYQWYNAANDEAIEGANVATFTPSAEGSYYVVVRHAAAGHMTREVKSANINVAHFDALAISSVSEDVFQHMGTATTLSVVATGKNVAYKWYTCADAAGNGAVAIDPAQTASSLTIASILEGVHYYKVVISHDCDEATLSHVFKVEGWDQLEQVDVTETTTWDMTNVSEDAINLKNLTPSKQNVRLLLANIEGVNNNASFNSQALMFEGQHIGRTSNNVKHLAGRYVQFNVTVPGMVSVTFASNDDNKERTIAVNGKKCTRDTTNATYLTYDVAVEPGSVEIIGYEGENANQYVRISKIEFKAEDNYHRTVNPSFLGTLCWTNNAILGGGTLYEFAGKNENNYLVFDEVEENRLEAGKPYIFMPENGNTEIKLYNTDDAAPLTENQPAVKHMYGTVVAKDLYPTTDVNMYYFSSNHIWAVKDFTSVEKITVPAYYCYVDYEGVLNDNPAPAPAPGRRRVTMGVNGKNTPTGIDAINASEQPMKLLINGQIFILRGEKMFDATGRLVK